MGKVATLNIRLNPSIRQYVLSLILQSRMASQRITPQPALKILRGEKYHSKRFFSFEEARQLLSHVKSNHPQRDYLMFATMRFAGLRAEELVTLTWGCLERNKITDGWQLRVTGKGNKERVVPIPLNLAEDLLAFRESVFPMFQRNTKKSQG